MPSARTLLLIRHAETGWNKEGRFQGQTDVPLSNVGREQARALRMRLLAHPELFDPDHTLVVSSDLARAHQTAEIAFGVEAREIRSDPQLREYRYGIFEGLTRDEIDTRYPGMLHAWTGGTRAYALDGGESRDEVYLRAHTAVERWLASSAHRTVIVVTHGGVMRQLLHRVLRERAGELSYQNVVTHALDVASEAWAYRGRFG